ncbi:MAG: type II restriction endonuclease [Phycisphaerae bacterium]|nr:type II restriction endonuclease [Phycisphaerae bacterium]
MTAILKDYLKGFSWKRAAAVEVRRDVSHQHEFNGVASLQKLLGTTKQTYPALFVRLTDNPDEAETSIGEMTWYDSRADHPTRTEWRLYYTGSEVMSKAAERDAIIIGLRHDGTLICVTVASGSTAEQQICWLLNIGQEFDATFTTRVGRELGTAPASALVQPLLDALQLTSSPADAGNVIGRRAIEKFGGAFPTSDQMSRFARDVCGVPSDDPDVTLLQWMEAEEAAFRAIEQVLVRARLRQGFGENVDEFIKFSLSVHNRRKARAGAALENHFSALLVRCEVVHQRGARTEGKSKPDILLPSASAYADPLTPDSRLAMVAIKTTCKERWTQILPEAARIRRKHLLTLEPAISQDQTQRMKELHVQLVVPRETHGSYTGEQRAWLFDVRQLVEELRQLGRA